MLMMLISILKTAKNLLRKILSQPEFEFEISCFAGVNVFPIWPPRHFSQLLLNVLKRSWNYLEYEIKNGGFH